MYFVSIISFPELDHHTQLKHFITQNLSAVPGLFHLASRPLNAPVPTAVNMGAHDSPQTEVWVNIRAVIIAPTAANMGVHMTVVNTGVSVSSQTELWVDVRAVSITPTAVNTGAHNSPQTELSSRDI